MDIKIKVSDRKIRTVEIIAIFTLLLSFIVMIGWILDIRPILGLKSGGATMKFNSALSFFILGTGILASLKKSNIYYTLTVSSVLGVLLINIPTLLQYFFDLSLNIDSFFVEDQYSTDYPGRMSPATTFCFILCAGALWGTRSKFSFLKKFISIPFLIVVVLSLVSILAYTLKVPGESKIFFFNTMSILTSVLFFLNSGAMTAQSSAKIFDRLLLSFNLGSQIVRALLPYVILLPLLIGYTLLYFLNERSLEADFVITIYTVVIILISIIYISIVANTLNRIDLKRTELKKSLLTTNQELTYFNQALDKSSIVVITDANGIINYVNDKFCEISKYKRIELIGKTHNIINSGYHSKDFFKKLWKTISTGEVWVGEIKNKAKDDSYYWVHTSIVPFKNESGQIYQYLAIKQDVTDRKRAEELLATNFKELQLKNKEIEQFAYIASHDLQEPLRTVMNFIEIFQEDYEDQLDDSAKKYLGFIDQASRRMSELIKGLLDYSRIGKEKKLVDIDCNELVKEVRTDLESVINRTGTNLQIADLPNIKGYKTELRLLFQNLMLNAIKFQNKDTLPSIKIGINKTNDHWQFSVKDNGIGIAAENKEKIFNIFHRLHHKNEFEGNGIGLSHCLKIVNLHNGKIWVDSEVGLGSTFYFTIPI